MIFAWNSRNIAHIAIHAIEPEEAVFVAKRARPPFPNGRENGKLVVRGPTSDGRWLQVIYILREPDTISLDWIIPEDRLHFDDEDGIGYVVHARELTESERQDTRKKLGRS